MNIKEAKEEIQNAVRAYLAKDEFGNYRIPIERQRPVFLVGPPGIGKTAIMEQIAQELNVGLVAYSMTHHTRQSAIGLPFIADREYDGREYKVSEYTMSEIIASVYDMIEQTGHREGILFLDEINCVSETLAPAMLQFLQYKIFGKHQVPDGWTIVTAGNPPEYNKSVREFDIVTWDRLKRMEVEADYEVWREYATRKGIHGVVITFLDSKRDCFYKVETTVDGKRFITARGWEDLSEMIGLYEELEIPVRLPLISQYIQNPQIARTFANYYDLYRKYRSDYQIADILAGRATQAIKSRARAAKVDERFALLGLLIDAIGTKMRHAFCDDSALQHAKKYLVDIRSKQDNSPVAETEPMLVKYLEHERTILAREKQAGTLTYDDIYNMNYTIRILEQMQHATMLAHGQIMTGHDAVEVLRGIFNPLVIANKNECKDIKKELSNLFAFIQEVFGNGKSASDAMDIREMTILVTELTQRYYCCRFVSTFGCDEYFANNNNIVSTDSIRNDLLANIKKLEESGEL